MVCVIIHITINKRAYLGVGEIEYICNIMCLELDIDSAF